ncbi:MAG TPA: ATP-dependent helicase, partial [bacterium]|nr:ATP-dependent helicase [bacterium]
MTEVRSDIDRVLDVLHQKQRRNITHWAHLPAEPARFADLPQGLSDELVVALKKRGFSKLYTHQASAFEAVRSGKDVVIVTP